MGYEVVEFDKAKDSERIIDVWKEAMGSNLDSRYDWIYNAKPVANPITVLLENIEAKRVVGCGSILQNTFYINQKPFNVGICVDFFVNAGHRTLGPAVMIQRWITNLLKTHPVDFLFAFPNKMALGSFLRVGYKKLGAVESYVKLLRFEEKLQKILNNNLLCKIAALPLNGIEWLYDSLCLLSIKKRYRADISTEALEGLTELINNTANRYPIVMKKNRDLLQWRYADMPGKDHRFFYLTDASTGELAGCLVFTVEKKVALIHDLLVPEIDLHLRPLLLSFTREMRKEKTVNSIQLCYIGNDHMMKILKKLLFVKRTSDRFCMVHIPKEMPEQMKKSLLSIDNWFLFEGDMDI